MWIVISYYFTLPETIAYYIEMFVLIKNPLMVSPPVDLVLTEMWRLGF